MLPRSVSFLAQPFKKKDVEPVAATPPSPPKEQVLPAIEDVKVRRILHDFFGSTYWPYVREILMREIIGFQMRADKQLQGSLSDPHDTNGKMAAYHGGRIKAGDELKLILERLKQNYSH